MVHGKDMRFFPHSYFSTPSMRSNLLIFGAMRGFNGGFLAGVYLYNESDVCFVQNIFSLYA